MASAPALLLLANYAAAQAPRMGSDVPVYPGAEIVERETIEPSVPHGGDAAPVVRLDGT